MEETYLVNLIKEKLCYISLDFLRDLELTAKKPPHNPIFCEYVLPDYVTIQEGYIRGQGEPTATSATTTTSTNTTNDSNNNNNTNNTTTTTATNNKKNKGKDTDADMKDSSKSSTKGTEKNAADEQVLKMNNERISIPELLFTPSDVGK